ncbi:hypothetical protein GUJ93_ZPchr0004g38669 [Zizania palustris]|uniref:Uncharacterized protein n=1 Tax=Zizania palustris TaxID=103762 RepID=A0A8J5SJD4_ZIZPA|nr:hypothetical protein GUJ93_ZPchr0004g38669 [Zizania palustris]
MAWGGRGQHAVGGRGRKRGAWAVQRRGTGGRRKGSDCGAGERMGNGAWAGSADGAQARCVAHEASGRCGVAMASLG